MSSRRRILTISKPYVAAAYRNKLTCLEALGEFDVGLICPPAWGAQALETSATPETFWMRTVPIALNGKNHFHWYKGLERAVREFAPDLLNVEEEHYSFVTWQAFRIAARLRIPAVFYTWQNIAKRYPPPFSLIERRIFRQAAAAVCGNHEAAEILRAKGYDGPIAEIPQMGVELARFAPPSSEARPGETRLRQRDALGLSRDAFWVGFVGRLVEEKGVQDMVEAVARLTKQSATAHVRALIVGAGPAKADLEARIAALGIGDRVRLLDFVPSHAVPAYLQAVDALCLPSLTRGNWKEQFGRVLVEAMAAEAVPVGSSSGEIPLVIGDSGLVFPEGDVAALANAIGRLATDSSFLEACRRRGAHRVRDLYTNDVIAKRFAAVFTAALAPKTRR